MKESGPILLVIDMQPKFRASNNLRCLNNCAREIRKAIRNGNRIIFVEYNGEGTTHAPLIQLVKKVDDYGYLLSYYPKYSLVGKTDDDGSQEIINHLRSMKRYGPYSFIVCGVNTDACVRKTVHGLAARRGVTITVVKDACNQPREWSNPPFDKMMNARNVVLV